MKNQIDQSTPFLAFYDLLRIRGIYSTEEKREKLRRGFRRAMALAAVFVGLALPQGARAAGSVLSGLATDGVIEPGSHKGLAGGTLMDADDDLRVGSDGSGSALFQTSGHWDVTGGKLAADQVYLLAEGGISFSGGEFNVSSLIAAAINKDDFSLGSELDKSEVTDAISGSAGGTGDRVYIGTSVGASSGTIVATDGMADGAKFQVGNGTITFTGDLGTGTLKAGNITFTDGATTAGTVDAGNSGTVSGNFTQSGGSVTAADITGKLTQSGGQAVISGTIASLEQTTAAVAGTSASAANITTLVQNGANASATATTAIGSLTQSAGTVNAAQITGVANQTGGTIDTGAATTLSVGAGSTLGSGTVTAGTVSVGSGSGALTLAGNELSGKTINAGAVTLGGAAGQPYSVSGAISSLATSGETAGSVTVSKTGTGDLSLGSIHAASLSASTVGGNITQTGATTLSGTGEKNVTLDAGTGTINLSQGVSGAGTLTLNSNATAAGNVTAAKIDATGKTLTQNGAGTITVSGADGIVASQVSQTYNGTEGARSTIRADKIEADFVQTGSYAAVDAFTENGTLDIKGNVSQNADNGVIGSSSTNVQLGDTGKPLDQDKGTIEAKELWICENSTSAGDIHAETITLRRRNGTWLELDQDGPGTITVTGAGITGSGIIQSSTGKIKTDRLNDIPSGGSALPAEDGIGGRITQTGAATLQAYNAENGLKIGGYLFQQNEGAVVGTDGEDVEIFGATDDYLKQDAGTIKAKTLTLHGDSTAAGNVTAGKIAAADGVTLTQNGAGTIKAASGEIELDVAVVQNADGATIGSTDTSVKVNKAFTQTAGKIEASTLTLNNAANDYALESTGNNVAKLSGNAKSVTLDDTARTGKLTLSGLDVGTDDGHTITVKKAADVEFAGVTAKSIAVTESTGAVTDTAAQADIATTVKLGDAATEKTVASVTLDDAKTLTLDGVNAAGAVTAKAETSLIQSGDIAGETVALSTDSADGLALGNVTSTGTGDAGTVSVTTRGGAISQQNGTAVTAPGAATFTAQNEAGTTTYGITLANGGENGNAFGSVGATGAAVQIGEKDATALNAISANSLTVTSAGAITQNGAVTSAERTTLSGSSITLERTDNDIGTKLGATASDGNVSIVNNGAIRIEAGQTVSGKNVSLEALGDEGYIFLDKRTVDPAHAVVSATDDDNGTITLTSHGVLGQGLPTTGIYQGTGAGVAAKNLVVHAAKDDGTALHVELNRGEENNVNSVQTLAGNGGSVNLKTSTALEFGAVSASSLDVQAGGAITQNANGGAITITAADGETKLTAGTNAKITLSQTVGGASGVSAGKLTLNSDTDIAADVTVSEIAAATHAVTQTGTGTIDVSGANGIAAATIAQNAGAGTIKAQKLDGAVNQYGGTINGATDNGNVEITGVLTQNAGTINLGAGTLTLRKDSTISGNITAAKIVAKTADETPVVKTLTQQAGTMKAASGEIELDANIVQNGANATVGSTTTSVKLSQSFNQQQGKIEADTLTLNNDAKDYDYNLESTGNNVATLSGTARSVTLDDTARTGKLTLSGLDVGTDDGHTITVKKAADVEFAGVTAKEIIVTEATGAVTDTEAQANIATAVKLGDDTHKVASVTLDNTKTLTLKGVNAAGSVTAKAETSLVLAGAVTAADTADVALQGGAFTQNGNAVQGKNVTIDVTGETGTTTVNGNITAKSGGDVLVKSAGAILIEGSGTAVASDSGSIVVSGAKGVTVKGATLSATATGEGIGLKADDSTDGNTADKVVVSDGATFHAETVVIDGEGGVEVGATGNRVQMKKNTLSTTPDSSLVIVTDRDVKGRFDSDYTPSSDVKIYRAKKFDVSAGDTVELNTLALKTTDSIENFTFKGTQLALESTEGSVEVTVTGGADDATRRTLTIFNNDPGEAVSAVVSAVNLVDSTQSPETVQAELDDSVAATGLVGTEVKLNVQSGKSVALTVEKGARIESTGTGNDLTLGSDGTTAGTLAAITVEAGTEATESAAEVEAGKIVAAGAVTAMTTGQMEINGKIQSTEDKVALTAGKYANVATTGSVTAKKDVSVTSNAGNVNYYGTAISTEGNVTLTATTADAPGQTGKSVKVGNGTTGAAITASAGKVTLDGGRSAQVLAGSTVTAKEFDAKADEYITIAGTVTATGKATAATDTKAVLTADPTMPAGVQVLAGGTLKSTGDAVEITSTGSVDLAGVVSAKTTLDITASGESTEAVQQGIQLAGTVSSEGKATLTAEKGGVRQTGGSLTAAGLEVSAQEIDQTGGYIAATGDTTLTATTGAIMLNAEQNDFDNVTAAAVSDVTLRDTDDLTLHGAAGQNGAALTGNATINAGNALTVDRPVNAGGAALLNSTQGGVTVSSTVTAPGAIVVRAEGNGTVTLTGATLDSQNVGIHGGSIPGLTAGQLPTAVNLALVSTAGNVELSGIPDTVANIGIEAADGDIVLTAQGDREFNGATVTAGGVTVRADGLAANGAGAGVDVTIENGNVTVGDVTAGGNATITATDGFVQAGNVTAGGAATIDAATTVTAGAIDANGGAATVTAGGAVTAASITGAQGTTVNAPGQAVTVAGQLGDGGDTAVTAGTLQSGSLASGGAATLTVAGDANVGQLAVGGDLNGATGAFTTTGGATGSIGQGGGLAVGGDMNIQGDLAAGGIAGTTVAGNLVVDGAVDAGDVDGLEIDGDMQLNADFAGDAVDITAANFVNGGGVLTAGQLTMAGNVGAAGNAFQVNSAQLQDVTGGQIYLVDTLAGPVALNVISATGGDAELQFNGEVNRMNAGSAGVSATGNIVLTTSSPFGALDAPIPVTYGGTLTVNGVNAPLLHIVIGGTLNNQDPLSVIYGDAGGFAIWQTPAGGYQIVGTSPENRRLINRALAFTVNTPELKSKQGVFGDPAFVHTKMNVSEARSIGNMDVLALNDVDYRRTWSEIIGNTANFELDWKPAVFVSENPLNAKLKSVQAESETQPEIYRFQRRMAAPATAPAPVTAVR